MRVAGVVAALAAEARTLDTAGNSGAIRIAVSGVGFAAAAEAAMRLADAGVAGLISWGMAGGLEPTLGAGAVCLPREILGPDGVRFATHRLWRETIAAPAGLGAISDGTLLTSLAALDTPESKQAAHRSTGAVIVDMESAAIAEVAAQRGLAFIAVRVVVDTALDAVPRVVAAATLLRGQVSVPRLLGGLIRSPGEIGSIMLLAHRYRRAIRSLTVLARAGGLAPPLTATALEPA